jgi:pimeloyl-ACP methyl ester carboxylesterase
MRITHFTRIAGLLRRPYGMIVPGLPGCGHVTGAPVARYTIADQVQRLQAFTAALSLNAFHLGGNSMGGSIAAEYAGREARQVLGLWLLDPAGTAAAQDTPMVQRYLATSEFPLLLRFTDDIGALVKAIASRPPLLLPSVKTVLARRGVADHAPAHPPRGGVRVADAGRSAAEHCCADADRLGRRRPGAESARHRVLHGRLPDSRIVLTPGIGHVPTMEAAQATENDYLRLRSDLRAAPGAGIEARPTLRVDPTAATRSA